jgi:hypothetical protein
LIPCSLGVSTIYYSNFTLDAVSDATDAPTFSSATVTAQNDELAGIIATLSPGPTGGSDSQNAIVIMVVVVILGVVVAILGVAALLGCGKFYFQRRNAHGGKKDAGEQQDGSNPPVAVASDMDAGEQQEDSNPSVAQASDIDWKHIIADRSNARRPPRPAIPTIAVEINK